MTQSMGVTQPVHSFDTTSWSSNREIILYHDSPLDSYQQPSFRDPSRWGAKFRDDGTSLKLTAASRRILEQYGTPQEFFFKDIHALLNPNQTEVTLVRIPEHEGCFWREDKVFLNALKELYDFVSDNESDIVNNKEKFEQADELLVRAHQIALKMQIDAIGIDETRCSQEKDINELTGLFSDFSLGWEAVETLGKPFKYDTDLKDLDEAQLNSLLKRVETQLERRKNVVTTLELKTAEYNRLFDKLIRALSLEVNDVLTNLNNCVPFFVKRKYLHVFQQLFPIAGSLRKMWSIDESWKNFHNQFKKFRADVPDIERIDLAFVDQIFEQLRYLAQIQASQRLSDFRTQESAARTKAEEELARVFAAKPKQESFQGLSRNIEEKKQLLVSLRAKLAVLGISDNVRNLYVSINHLMTDELDKIELHVMQKLMQVDLKDPSAFQVLEGIMQEVKNFK